MLGVTDLLTTAVVAPLVGIVFGYILLFREKSGIPPGPTFWPIVGNIFDMRGKYLGKRHKYLEEMKAKYGAVFRVYLGNQLTVFLNDYDTIKEAIVDKKSVFIARPTKLLWTFKKSAAKGPGLAMANGDEWEAARGLVMKAFREIGKTSFEDIVNDEITDILAGLSGSEGRAISIRVSLIKASTSITARVTFGSRLDFSKEIDNHIFETALEIFKGEGPMSPLQRLPYLRFLPSVATKIKETVEGVNKTRAEFSRYITDRKNNSVGNQNNDLIDVFLSRSTGGENEEYVIDEQNLTRIILDLFAAGSIANGNVMDWAFLYMIIHPEIQQKCQDEIDKVVGSSRRVKWDDKPNLPYTDATLMEAYRLGNNAPLSVFHMNTEDAYVSGYFIPKETIVIPNILSCHLDKKTWGDPMVFRPERFFDHGHIKPNPAFMPFMIGPRYCPGKTLGEMQIFLVFANVLQSFVLSQEKDVKLSTEGTYGINLETPPYKIHAKRR